MHFLKVARQIRMVDQMHLFVVVVDQMLLCQLKGFQLEYLVVRKHSAEVVVVVVVAAAAVVVAVVELWIVLMPWDSLIQTRNLVQT